MSAAVGRSQRQLSFHDRIDSNRHSVPQLLLLDLPILSEGRIPAILP